MRHPLVTKLMLALTLTFSSAATASEPMVSTTPEPTVTIDSPSHGTTPDAHGHAHIASYVNLAVTYAAVSDVDGNIFTAVGVDLKPLSVSLDIGNKIIRMSFLESSVLVRVSDASVAHGDIETTNTYSVRLMNSEMNVTDRFVLGLSVVRPLIRDSMNSTAIDWAQLTAAFTIAQSESQRLVASVTPFVRTVIPYTSTGNATSEQLWMPIKLTYNFRHNRLSFSASGQYIPIMNLTRDRLSQALVFGGGIDYRITAPDHRFDLHLFFDGQVWVQSDSNSFTVRNPLDLSSFLLGLRMNF